MVSWLGGGLWVGTLGKVSKMICQKHMENLELFYVFKMIFRQFKDTRGLQITTPFRLHIISCRFKNCHWGWGIVGTINKNVVQNSAAASNSLYTITLVYPHSQTKLVKLGKQTKYWVTGSKSKTAVIRVHVLGEEAGAGHLSNNSQVRR